MSNSAKLRLCYSVFLAAMLNFVVFFIVAARIGGDAVNGRVRDGRFYVMNHGRYTEVSERVFTYSRWHVYSIWMTHPLALAAGYWAKRLQQADSSPPTFAKRSRRSRRRFAGRIRRAVAKVVRRSA
jgi:hypothetical protein